MSIKDPRLHRTQCSANSLYRMRKSCAQKELQSHGVEDGLGMTPSYRPAPVPNKYGATSLVLHFINLTTMLPPCGLREVCRCKSIGMVWPSTRCDSR